MIENAASLLIVLLRTSLLLGAAAMIVQLLLNVARPGSSWVHRAAWFFVLLQGWFWWRLPVNIPWPDPTIVKLVSSASLIPVPLPSTIEASRQTADLDHAAVVDASMSHREQLRQHWPAAILGSWAAGMLILAGASMVSYLRFLRYLHATQPVEEIWKREWEDLLARHHVRSGVPLWVTSNVGPLVCFGPSGHRLVVPVGLWQRLTPAGRVSILRHELAHLQRRDLLKSILVRLLMLPHWFNPLAWLAVRRFDEAAEWACDEVATGTGLEGRRIYAAALLQLDAAHWSRPSYHAAASGHGLSVRVQRLLSPLVKEDSLMKKITILGTALGLAVLCLVRFDLVAKEPAEERPVEKIALQKSSVKEPTAQPLVDAPPTWDKVKANRSQRGRAKRESHSDSEKVLTLTYNVADLVTPLPTLHLPAHMAKPQAGQADIKARPMPPAKPGAGPAEAKDDFSSLVELITSTIKPNSWKAAGGGGSIAIIQANLSIVVTQTRAVHEELEDLLQQLRRLQDRSIVLEMKLAKAADESMPDTSKNQGTANRKAGTTPTENFIAMPQISLMNGQMAYFVCPVDGGSPLQLFVQAVVSNDRRFIRLWVGAAETRDRSVVPGVMLAGASVADGRSLAVGLPLAAMAHRKLVITPRVVIQEEEEEKLGVWQP